MIDTPRELTKALQATDKEVEITQSLYEHFMNVLPPREMGCGYFIFQEGDGARLYFAQAKDGFISYLLSDYLITDDWSYIAHVSRGKLNDPFKVNFISSNQGLEPVPINFTAFVGKEFDTILALANVMNVSFRA